MTTHLAHPRQHVPPGADASAPLLQVSNLTTEFSLKTSTVYAVDNVSFDLHDGEAIGIAGESGCGKTTTALSLVQLLPSNAKVSGSVKLQGIELLDKSERELTRYRWREISIIFQGAMNALNPVKRLGDQIAEAMLVHHHVDERGAKARTKELLEFVGIPARRAAAYPHQLSGGMRQRAMIAMALSCDPSVVIGDEPTTALDVMVQAQIMELFARLRRELGLSLLLITHDLSVISETCDRVIIMYAGRIAEEGPVRQVFRNPRHPYTQGLLSAFPSIRAQRRTLDVIAGSPPDLKNPPPGCRFAPRCAFVMDICTQVVPPEVTLEDGVRVACHLHPGPSAAAATAGASRLVVPAGAASTATGGAA